MVSGGGTNVVRFRVTREACMGTTAENGSCSGTAAFCHRQNAGAESWEVHEKELERHFQPQLFERTSLDCESTCMES